MENDSKIVRFENSMNELNLKNFNEKELNFLMLIFSQIRNKGDQNLLLPYADIKKSIGWRKRDGNDYFNSVIEKLTEKGRTLGGTFKKDKMFISGNVFCNFIGQNDEELLYVRLNPECTFMLNGLINNFTEFELKKYLLIKGNYTKHLFQHLCQYRNSGLWIVSRENLAFYLCIPESMLPHKYMYQVVNPSIKELEKIELFKNLKCEGIREGRTIKAYKFTWEPEKRNFKTPVKQKNKFCEFQQTAYDWDEFEKSVISN